MDGKAELLLLLEISRRAATLVCYSKAKKVLWHLKGPFFYSLLVL